VAYRWLTESAAASGRAFRCRRTRAGQATASASGPCCPPKTITHSPKLRQPASRKWRQADKAIAALHSSRAGQSDRERIAKPPPMHSRSVLSRSRLLSASPTIRGTATLSIAALRFAEDLEPQPPHPHSRPRVVHPGLFTVDTEARFVVQQLTEKSLAVRRILAGPG
jgi:hypothetical protein